MPTEPVKEILDSEHTLGDIAGFVALACPIVRESVNEGTWVFKRCERGIDEQGGPDVDLPPFALYRQVLEQVDAVEILLRHGCATAAVPLLRSSLEAGLGLQFIAKRKDTQVNLAWMVTYIHQRLRGYEQLARNGTAQAAWNKQFGTDLDVPYDLPAAIGNLRAWLANDTMRPLDVEYQRLRQRRKQVPWYALFNGPANLADLSREVGRHAEYLVLYGPWSRLTHGNDLASAVVRPPGQPMAWRSLRYPEDMKPTAIFAIGLMIEASRSLIAYARPGESIKAWYQREIQTALRNLRDLKIVLHHSDDPPAE